MLSLAEIFRHYAIDVLAESVRYIFFAGATFLLFWVLLRKRLGHKMIQGKYSTPQRLTAEFWYSMSSIAIFGIIGTCVFIAIKNGYGNIYHDIGERGWLYFFVSIGLAIIIHDAYFYFTHRLMHHPALFKHVHLVHHKSTNPSPWAAYSFHPFEAIIQGLIGPILVFTLPMNLYALLGFAIFQITYNVLGHSSIELLPKGFTKSLLFWHNTPTHHNMHHRYFNCNYCIYFNWWDRIFGTMHARYDETFEEVASREREIESTPKETPQVPVMQSVDYQ